MWHVTCQLQESWIRSSLKVALTPTHRKIIQMIWNKPWVRPCPSPRITTCGRTRQERVWLRSSGRDLTKLTEVVIASRLQVEGEPIRTPSQRESFSPSCSANCNAMIKGYHCLLPHTPVKKLVGFGITSQITYSERWNTFSYRKRLKPQLFLQSIHPMCTTIKRWMSNYCVCIKGWYLLPLRPVVPQKHCRNTDEEQRPAQVESVRDFSF